jgi:hypothetical protein
MFLSVEKERDLIEELDEPVPSLHSFSLVQQQQ